VSAAALLALSEDIFAALAARDKQALGRIVAEDFVLRVPGQPDVDRAAFLAIVDAIPGDILSVAGEDVRAELLPGGLARVSGLQLARVRLDGQIVEDRQSFVDLFERRGDRWLLVWAFSAVPPG
jgi:hypothetical protein